MTVNELKDMSLKEKNLLQQMNKLEQINLEFKLSTGYHSFITLGINVMTTIVSFLHLAGVVNRGGCGLSQQDLSRFQNAHEAHGLHVYWQAEETHKGRKLTLKSSALLL